jgi:hypothetical protein
MPQPQTDEEGLRQAPLREATRGRDAATTALHHRASIGGTGMSSFGPV